MALRVAIDANVLISGIVWPRWQYEILMHASSADFTLVLSPIALDEARRRVTTTFPAYLERFESYLLLVDYKTAPVPTAKEIAANQDLVRQKKDIPLALSIIAASVDYFVTYDRDFTDEDETTAKVRAAIPGIILPPVFLREVMHWTSEELEAIRHRGWEDVGSRN
jgi:predicted nucleic acid-binding protein